MPLDPNINTREFDKFAFDPELETVVKVLAKIFGGEITILSPDDFKITTLDIGDVATKLPATPAAGRISMDIRNLSGINEPNDILYIGPNASVTATDTVGTSSGWQIGPGEGDNVELRASKEAWAIAPAGLTIRVQVREWVLS